MSEAIPAAQPRLLLAALFDSSAAAIMGKDVNRVMTSGNAGARRILG